MIFKQEFVDMIISGKKTQTRRPNRGYYVVGKTYAIQPCRICKGIEGYRIMMDAIWEEISWDCFSEPNIIIKKERYLPIREDRTANAEGYKTTRLFEEAFREIYPKWDGKKRWAYEFHVVEVTNENK
jgi:hypothetical protein